MGVNRIARVMLSGMAVVLPLLITIYLVFWLFRTAESALGGVVKAMLPEGFYHGGMGIVAAVVIIFLVGLLTEAILFRRLLKWMEHLLGRVPLVKTIYGAVRDMMSLFSQGEDKQKFSKVVLIDVPGLSAQLLGFITIDDHKELPFKAPDETVAVYFPLSYQIGGYTLFMPRERLKAVDMSMEDAMRFIVTAGMSRSA